MKSGKINLLALVLKKYNKLLNKQKRSDRLIIFATHNRFFANKADCLLEMIDGSIKATNV